MIRCQIRCQRPRASNCSAGLRSPLKNRLRLLSKPCTRAASAWVLVSGSTLCPACWVIQMARQSNAFACAGGAFGNGHDFVKMTDFWTNGSCIRCGENDMPSEDFAIFQDVYILSGFLTFSWFPDFQFVPLS